MLWDARVRGSQSVRVDQALPTLALVLSGPGQQLTLLVSQQSLSLEDTASPQQLPALAVLSQAPASPEAISAPPQQESPPHDTSLPVSAAFIMAAAHPTPLSTAIASVGQFI